MTNRSLHASALIAVLVTISISLTTGPMNAIAMPSISKAGQIAKQHVIEIRHRRRGKRLVFPIAPSYLAYDYPYYYSRGHYPTHIGPGYIYFGHPYPPRNRQFRK
jgi:hypothetical protein